LLKEALDRGHIVTAIVPHPEKLAKREGLTARAGDVYDTTSLATLIQGNGAIIGAFNPGWKDPNLYVDQVRGTASIIAAIKNAGIKRVLWVGGAGGWVGGQTWSPRRRQPRSPELGEAWFSGDDRCSGPIAERTGT
jgi:putative NADH-flavin reductase